MSGSNVACLAVRRVDAHVIPWACAQVIPEVVCQGPGKVLFPQLGGSLSECSHVARARLACLSSVSRVHCHVRPGPASLLHPVLRSCYLHSGRSPVSLVLHSVQTNQQWR